MDQLLLFIIGSIIGYLLYLNYSTNKYDLYNSEYWTSYRLGDIVSGYMIRSDAEDQKQYLKDISTRWPGSIADNYVKRCGYPETFKMNDLDILVNILDEMDYEKPDKYSLVIHIRLGDVVTMWSNKEVHPWMNNNNYYVKGPEYYKKLLNKIKQNDNIHDIRIITGTHSDKGIDASIKYLDNIVSIFDNDYEVEVKITNNPDKDLYYMCHSRYFCPSGGGYSELIRGIVTKKNNIIVR